MAIYVTRWFARWAKQQGLTDEALCRAGHEMSKGLYEADLGCHLLKKRIARPGSGKRGGFRTLVATNFAGVWFFLYGYAKNEREEVEPCDVAALKKLAKSLVGMSHFELLKAQDENEIARIDYDA